MTSTPGPTSTQFRVRPGVFFRIYEDGEGVALDVGANRYLGLSARAAAALEAVATGRSSTPPSGLASLVELGLVSDRVVRADPALSRVSAPSGIEGARHEAADPRPTSWRPRRLVLASSLLWHTRRLRALVKHRGILRAIDALAPRPTTATVDRRRERDLLAAYALVRAVLQESDTDCVGRSLGLSHVGRSIGLPYDFVVGARKFPFQAHAWVEAPSHLVNATQLELLGYKRLLVAS